MVPRTLLGERLRGHPDLTMKAMRTPLLESSFECCGSPQLLFLLTDRVKRGALAVEADELDRVVGFLRERMRCQQGVQRGHGATT